MTSRSNIVDGRLVCLIYSPRGDVEGMLMSIDSQLAQVVVDRHDDETPALLARLEPGQSLRLKVELEKHSGEEAEHAVYDCIELLTVDGVTPTSIVAADMGYSGLVVRLNYARHGAANGVVLDTGDFIHLKPEGMKKFQLKVGDAISANGDAQMLSTGTGWAVEATTVNGRAVKSGH